MARYIRVLAAEFLVAGLHIYIFAYVILFAINDIVGRTIGFTLPGHKNHRTTELRGNAMKFKFFPLLGALAAIFIAATPPCFAKEPVKIALQISDNNAEKMNSTLNVAANLSRYYSEKGEEVQIEIVAFIAGLHMLREDTSPVKARLKSFKQSLPNVVFRACKNTLDGMAKKEGKVPPLVDNAHLVPAGVVKLVELSKEGYTIIRP